jgi:hypothetical protein
LKNNISGSTPQTDSGDYGEFFSEIGSQGLEENGNTEGREILLLGTRKTVSKYGQKERNKLNE